MTIGNLYDQLVHKLTKLSVIGLGYVGLPLAVAFSKVLDVVGYDIDTAKVNSYKKGQDVTGLLKVGALRSSDIEFTTNANRLDEALFHIIAVPTPIDNSKMPDLSYLMTACKTLGNHLKRGSIVVIESTVYPGITQDFCLPILEEASGLNCPADFGIGYSPERINPGDRTHTLSNTTKIISAISSSTLTIVKKVYQLIIQAELYCAESIKIAEAAKLLENCYRDVNIAFMNEFAKSLRSTGLESELVFEAARTKWNFSKFYPGLVGGHCICVDPYYYMAYAKKNNISVPLISKARDINEAMTNLVVQELQRILMQNGKELSTSKIGLLGLTYKSNCNDLRNSKALKLAHSLTNIGAQVLANDPYLTNLSSIEKQNLTIVELDAIVNCDAIIVATAHDSYRQLTTNYISRMLGGNSGIIIDIYGIFDRNSLNAAGHTYWRL